MCDFFEDFDDLENEFDENLEDEESFDDDLKSEGESTEDDSCDDKLTLKETVILGGAMGWAYEEGHRRKMKRKMFRKK